MPTPTSAPHHPLQLPALAGWLILTFIFAAIGAYASAQAADFYLQLDRPDWAPPAWLFGPAWSALYLLMAVAAWRVQRATTTASGRPALTLYVVQLAANALWTWLFFGWHLGAWAFVEILLLWVLIAATIAAFWRRDRMAGLLLVPYIGWVSFATCLCYSIWQRNPSVL
ncbi:tryptophan-rich sensory protein [Duganella sp. FT109W]|uniref:Tryptophan-rich sensory protein n=1 Tax=Duganella margarita TaxID=2692170 RepID=A0ABW9WKK3_9BURK|nr:TspO/MBR family protein [Duganella margarita]MYN41421.1 tryptophan-rich sensory protein [Duganella margarita]